MSNEKWLRTGRTVYALNDRGVNTFFASVQDAHTEEKELERIAELMRCAPELLEALQLITQWRGTLDRTFGLSAKSAIIEDFDDAISVIAKATGG